MAEERKGQDVHGKEQEGEQVATSPHGFFVQIGKGISSSRQTQQLARLQGSASMAQVGIQAPAPSRSEQLTEGSRVKTARKAE